MAAVAENARNRLMVSGLGGNDGVLAVLGWDGQSRVNRCVRMGEVFWHRREEGRKNRIKTRNSTDNGDKGLRAKWHGLSWVVTGNVTSCVSEKARLYWVVTVSRVWTPLWGGLKLLSAGVRAIVTGSKEVPTGFRRVDYRMTDGKCPRTKGEDDDEDEDEHECGAEQGRTR